MRHLLRSWMALVALSIALVACGTAEAPIAEGNDVPATDVTETSRAASEPAQPATTADATDAAEITEAPETGSGETIPIGFVGPLTGPTASAGEALLHGAQQRVDEINAAGGLVGRQVELVSCDDNSEQEQGVRCATRLIEQDGVFAIVGTLHSPILAAIGPITDEAQVPLTGSGTGPFVCEEGFEYLWRSAPNSNQEAAALSTAIESLEVSDVALLYQDDDFGASGAESVRALGGFDIVADETYTPGDRDFSGQIINIQAASPDAVVVWGLGQDLGFVVNQLRLQGWDGPIMGTAGFAFPEVAEVAGENVDGVTFGWPYYVPESIEEYPEGPVRDFLETYLDTHGAMPASDNAYRAYDGMLVIEEGVTQAGELDPVAVKEAIDGITDLEGLAGTYDFSDGCEGIDSVPLWTYEGTQIVPFDG